ncbi:aminotransferase class I/II-fold pyridoxal phosphate-dependent enzyme [Maridesulfovibrio hydrothermalis]|uniref:Putative 8-amino-7-oxononanoate synthase n=1 Tax=Maridesulfovibrio hydrothermalis AM13 = DSM 14728 TaxID=1121451 RepID=L0RFW0_9BACT|nr:8-amino-7-oxononanoate synthase [Maridesulfovibrio hydrothermalis]CCO25095.1 putative 8-amino-7-oxononanoate synthase [Maridesulfovibrio hydrothermalis AM13 = DSM 14728]
MSSKKIYSQVQNELADLGKVSMLRVIPDVEDGASRELLFKGERLLNLASNDYLGLASDENLREAAVKAINKYGCGAAASRLVTGNFGLYDELEQEIANFKEQDDAILFASGYAANLSIMDSFADRRSVVFSDKLNHASIIDGIKMSGARQVRYHHNDISHLKMRIESFRDVKSKILITDTIFSMDGDLAYIEEVADLCDFYEVMLIVDEAHAEGVFGGGKGLCFERKVSERVDLHMGAFSKAFGSLGGAASGNKDLMAYLRNKGRSFVFSTALPPAVVGANLAALRLVKDDSSRGTKLLEISRELKTFLQSEGFDCANSASQIIPVILGENEKALEAQKILMNAGLYVAAIRPPTVPKNTARLRLSLRADLTANDLAKIKNGFVKLKKELA